MCSNYIARSRLLTVSKWESGLWLQVLPSHNTIVLMDLVTFRLSTSLRLGTVLYHQCLCCTVVEQLGRQGISCTSDAGAISWQASLSL